MDTNQEEETMDQSETVSDRGANASRRLEEEITQAEETEDIHLQNLPLDDSVEVDDDNTNTKTQPTLPNSAENKGEPREIINTFTTQHLNNKQLQQKTLAPQAWVPFQNIDKNSQIQREK